MGLTVFESMSLARDIANWAELLEYLREHYDFWSPDEKSVTLEWYASDERIGWDTWLLCVDGKAALFTDGMLADMPPANVRQRL